MPYKPILLATSSPYRRNLMEKLRLPFTTASPDIDESSRPGEDGEALTTRLANSKARALAAQHPGHLIIGSDQVAELDNGTLLTKPGNHRTARAQLSACSSQTVLFLTGLALLDSDSGTTHTMCERFRVHFRTLSPEQIDAYLQMEKPWDCAGSFRMEGMGVSLFSSFEGRDPNSLIGLPLIALNDLLQKHGVDPILEAYRNSTRD